MGKDSTDAQLDLYGATWATRFAAIRQAYGLSQGGLAAIAGLSAPMVSQLVSGRRVKISNPTVLARIVFLEERMNEPGVINRDQRVIDAVLAEVASSSPELRSTAMSTSETRVTVTAWLETHASSAVLRELAMIARAREADDLADVLDEAAGQL